MEKTFGQLIEDIKAMHGQMRPAYEARPITGKRIAIARKEKPPVDAILYQPEQSACSKLPVFFNMHGGGFTGGDAVLMDTFCRMLSEALPADIVRELLLPQEQHLKRKRKGK